jgi:hypothetical protein
VQLSLEQRLLRLLTREERDEQRTHRELRAQPVELRVLASASKTPASSVKTTAAIASPWPTTAASSDLAIR